jgi:hypothetical protein
MLSIAGQIYAEKQRKLSVLTFSDLVVVKLNVEPLNKIDLELVPIRIGIVY